jgi:hypothetical protein
VVTSPLRRRRVIILLAPVPARLLLDRFREDLALRGDDVVGTGVEGLGVLVGGVGDGGDDPWLCGVLGDFTR